MANIKQIKAARELLGWSQEKLVEMSGVSISTIKRLEAEGGDLGGRPTTGEKIVAALEKAGVEFIDEDGGGAGVRLKPKKDERKARCLNSTRNTTMVKLSRNFIGICRPRGHRRLDRCAIERFLCPRICSRWFGDTNSDWFARLSLKGHFG
jgi:transcriptional regulator with XRE-family HTH domain